MRVLVVNAGSSTLKLSLIGDDDAPLCQRELAAPGNRRARGAAGGVGRWIRPGGHGWPPDRSRWRAVRDTRPNRSRRRGGAARAGRAGAPAPAEIARGAGRGFPRAAQPPGSCLLRHGVSRDDDPAATTYALPASWRERWHIHRYGFTGSRTRGSPAARRSCSMPRRTGCGSSAAIWAQEPPCVRSPPAGHSIPR